MLLSSFTCCTCDACGDVTSGRCMDLEERLVPHCCRVLSPHYGFTCSIRSHPSRSPPMDHRYCRSACSYCRSVAQTGLWTTVLSSSILDLLVNLCVCVIVPSLQPLSCISWPWPQSRPSAGLLLDTSSAERDPVRAEICLTRRRLTAHHTLALAYCRCGCFSGR